jgi:hypothetical protein
VWIIIFPSLHIRRCNIIIVFDKLHATFCKSCICMEQQQSHEDCFVSYFSGHFVFTADGSIMPMYLRGTETYSCPHYLVERLVLVLRSVDAHCVSF